MNNKEKLDVIKKWHSDNLYYFRPIEDKYIDSVYDIIENGKITEDTTLLDGVEIWYHGAYYFSKKNYDTAIKYFEIGILKKNSHCANTLGYYYQSIKDYNLAMKFYKIALDMGDMCAPYCIAYYYINNNDKIERVKDDIIKYLKISIDRGYDYAIHELAFFYSKIKDSDNSLKYALLGHEKNIIGCSKLLIAIYTDSKNEEKVLQYCDELIAKNNNFGLFMKGALYMNFKQYDKMIDYYSQTCKFNLELTDNINSTLNYKYDAIEFLVECYYSKKISCIDIIKDCCNIYIDECSIHKRNALTDIGNLFGKFDTTLMEEYHNLCIYKYDCSDSCYNMAIYYKSKSNIDKMKYYLNIGISKKNAGSYNLMGIYYKGIGDEKNMIDCYNKAIEYGNSNAAENLAKYYYCNNNYDKVCETCILGIEKFKSPKLMHYLAISYYRPLRDNENMVKYLTMAAEKNYYDAIISLCDHYAKIGDYENKMKYYFLALDSNIDNSLLTENTNSAFNYNNFIDKIDSTSQKIINIVNDELFRKPNLKYLLKFKRYLNKKNKYNLNEFISEYLIARDNKDKLNIKEAKCVGCSNILECFETLCSHRICTDCYEKDTNCKKCSHSLKVTIKDILNN